MPPPERFGISRHTLPESEALNRALAARFDQLLAAQQLRGSHHFGGRFENLYAERQSVPGLEPIIQATLQHAAVRLGCQATWLRIGFWFNAMDPGHETLLHSHDDDDELLSAVYYIQVPENAGNFVAEREGEETEIEPREGDILLFPPDLLHAVRANRSKQRRLSVAFNIGAMA
ncbi:MAG: 2OG-Fe(II) oxygenase [Chromatiales bacterium]|nr:2OG-Fe(II) oxygenase [Chromatiales bacterium]